MIDFINIYKKVFNRLNSINKICKFIMRMKDIYKKSIIINIHNSNITISINKYEYRIYENSLL